MSIRNAIKKSVGFVKENKVALLQVALMVGPSVCSASTAMPWDSGITSLKDNLTGPLPKAGAVISIAVGGTLYAIGQSDISRMAMKGAFGTAIACGAATLAGLFGWSEGSGCIFF